MKRMAVATLGAEGSRGWHGAGLTGAPSSAPDFRAHTAPGGIADLPDGAWRRRKQTA
jgi:hypothetical protein